VRAILKFFSALAASLLIYFALTAFVLHKPLTGGLGVAVMNAKMVYARSLPSPKLVIFAGSNGWYSHSCKVLAETLHIPCANMAVEAGLGIDYRLRALATIVHRGDVVYVPLEYDQYSGGIDLRLHGEETPELMHSDKRSLLSLGPNRFLYGLFGFDLASAISAGTEMVLNWRHFQRRITVSSMNAWGDQTSNTEKNARDYRAWIAAQPTFEPPSVASITAPSDSKRLLAAFLVEMKRRGVLVIGGLPTVFNDRPIPQVVIAALAAFYHGHGADFLVIPGHSQYPRAAFFDTPSHLIQPAQLDHSKALAKALSQPWAPR
jgi:hypothetical protein